MPKIKRPYVVSLDQVRIVREDMGVFIDYADPDIGGVHFTLGEKADSMSDQEILDLHNEGIEARQAMADEYEHVAIEIPPGLPQIEYFKDGHQWVPRGDVLRCVISDGGGSDNQAVIHIDDHDLSVDEFGRLLTTYAGWGMRITFVPDDETHERPEVEVRDPEPRG